MDEAEALCDRVAVVDKGSVIALGTPRELIRSLGAEHVVEFAMAEGVPRPTTTVLRALPGVQGVRQRTATCALIASEMHLAVPALLDALGDRRSALALPDHAQRDARGRLRGAHRTAPARCLSARRIRSSS